MRLLELFVVSYVIGICLSVEGVYEHKIFGCG